MIVKQKVLSLGLDLRIFCLRSESLFELLVGTDWLIDYSEFFISAAKNRLRSYEKWLL